MGAVDEASVDLLKRSTTFWNEPCVDLVEPPLAANASSWALDADPGQWAAARCWSGGGTAKDCGCVVMVHARATRCAKRNLGTAVIVVVKTP